MPHNDSGFPRQPDRNKAKRLAKLASKVARCPEKLECALRQAALR
jgi:hypothetical protein